MGTLLSTTVDLVRVIVFMFVDGAGSLSVSVLSATKVGILSVTVVYPTPVAVPLRVVSGATTPIELIGA